MIRKDKRYETVARGVLACVLLGWCGFGLVGCSKNSPTDDPRDAVKPLMLSAAQPRPKFELTGGTPLEDGAEFEFGSTEIGQEFTHEFTIKNVGDADLDLTKGQPSCGTCTSFEVDKLNVKPGETAKVTVKWKIQAENPVFRQHVPIKTNLDETIDGPRTSEIKLYVKGKVVQRIVLRPLDKWDMGVTEEGKPLEFSATIASSVVDHFDVVSLTSENPNLTVTATPFSASQLKEQQVKSGYDLKAVLKGEIPVGEFKDKIKIALRTPNEVSLNVEVTAKRNGPVEIIGTNWDAKRMMVRLGSFDASKDYIQRLNLYTHGIPELQVKKVTSIDPRFTIEVVPDVKFKGASTDHRRYDLFVKYKGSSKEAVYPLQQPLELDVQSNVPSVETIKIKVLSQGTLRD
jgi:hypothetical protein